MKKLLLVFSILLLTISSCGPSRQMPPKIAGLTPKDVKYMYMEASDLNLIGKILPDTPNPYHRVDTCKYKGFTPWENGQLRCPTGLAVLFRTNSTSIAVKTEWGSFLYESVATMPMAYRGYDLYIREKGKWVWAGAAGKTHSKPEGKAVLVKNMDGSMHECMLYLPIYTEVKSVGIGVDAGSVIEPMESPFRHRICFYGSSYTHGVSTSRAGLSYPMQFMRHTGFQVLSFAMSGRCLMQSYSAAVLEDIDADAYVFDTFSNPDAAMIKERLIPFIDRMIAAHPGKPLIFQQTIRREARNFDMEAERRESAKQAMAERLFKDIILKDKKYKDVYFIRPKAWVDSHEATVDGVHPNDYGYYLWSRSIEKPILDILAKYGIK